ncbi:hypothetical protein G3545_04455 [Starkeya sp. ORNL1]|uniref:hypothetical protein n=1 Tax=Starkeya sp. ORNL1 TaxID=2709380 RepID=UPI0014636838|nr:hypothetical protein [Starkeya sp. ORNL1]QJP12973.1 hypothetical protein G3545_04455 [Starkeya sp. ORNL1]
MPFMSQGYDPEMIALLEECLNSACAATVGSADHIPDDELRRRLAAALLEGAGYGMTDREALIGFALSALPTFREALTRPRH